MLNAVMPVNSGLGVVTGLKGQQVWSQLVPRMRPGDAGVGTVRPRAPARVLSGHVKVSHMGPPKVRPPASMIVYWRY
jgi:hypothetical protein